MLPSEQVGGFNLTVYNRRLSAELVQLKQPRTSRSSKPSDKSADASETLLTVQAKSASVYSKRP